MRLTTDAPSQPCTTTSGPRPMARAAALSLGIGAAAAAAIVAPAMGQSPSTSLTASPAADLVAEALVVDRTANAERAAARSSRSAVRSAVTLDDVVPEAPADEAVPADAPADESDAELPSSLVAPELEVEATRYTTVDLNVRLAPGEDAEVVKVLKPGTKVKITDVRYDEWRQIVHKGEPRWVKGQYLSKSKPEPKPAGPSGEACASGSGVERGLAANTIAVHRAVCNAFPSVTSFGGLRGGGGNHGSGRALDIMVTGSTGDAIAAYVRANAAALGVTEVIWEQKIWTTQRASDGWRWMSDRGSATANHYDHVHVSTR